MKSHVECGNLIRTLRCLSSAHWPLYFSPVLKVSSPSPFLSSSSHWPYNRKYKLNGYDHENYGHDNNADNHDVYDEDDEDDDDDDDDNNDDGNDDDDDDNKNADYGNDDENNRVKQ